MAACCFKSTTHDTGAGAPAVDCHRLGIIVRLYQRLSLDRYFQIGASGGTSNTIDPKATWRDNAYVKIRPIRFNSAGMKVADPFQD